MNYEFIAELTARMEMTDDEFDYLFDAFKKHYDHHVKSSAEHGGWLYGLKVRRTPWKGATHDDVDKWIEVKNRQLQLCIKSLELHNNATAFDLTSKFCNLYHKLVEQTNFVISILNQPKTSINAATIKSGTMMKCEAPHAQCENLTAGKSYRVVRTNDEKEKFTIIDDNGRKRTYKFDNSQFIIQK